MEAAPEEAVAFAGSQWLDAWAFYGCWRCCCGHRLWLLTCCERQSRLFRPENGAVKGWFGAGVGNRADCAMVQEQRQRQKQIPFGNDNQKAEQWLGMELLEEVAEGVASVADVPFLVAGDFGEGLVE